MADNIGYLTLSGSRAYGTDIEGSDIDIRGFYFENPYSMLGIINQPPEQFVFNTADTVIYSFRKFCSLALKGNPNCLELLGTREEDTILVSEEAKWLRENVKLFISKQIYNPFSGYVKGMLKMAMKFIDVNDEKAYKTLAHALRALYMGRDIFTTGCLVVRRPEATYLKEVINGVYDFGTLKLRVDSALQEFEEAFKNTAIPEEPATVRVNKFIVRTYLHKIENLYGRALHDTLCKSR